MNEHNLIYTLAKEYMTRASNLLSLLMPQTSGVGIGVKGLDGRYQLANRAMEALLGKNAGQITGMTDTELLPPEVAAQLQRSDRQITDGVAATSDELDLSINGMPIRCLWLKFPVPGPDGVVLFVGAVMLDMSRQEVAAAMHCSLERLQQTNQKFRKTVVELDRLASTDKLTGAWNRQRLEAAVINEMDRLKWYDLPLSLLIIDLDLFKNMTVHHGHAVGDQVLAELAAVVRTTIRATDSLTRWGGQEFVVLCPNTALPTVAVLAEQLREKIATAVFPVVKNISVSIGVAECMSGETWAHWFERADAALERAKASGRNQVQIAPETPPRVGDAENVPANLVKLSWHSAYECGIASIDEEHRGLFDDANNLFSAIRCGRPADEVAALIDALINDVVQHFQDEEVIITAAGYPGAAEHAAIHRTLVDRAATLANRFHGGTLAFGDLFQFLARDLIALHMLGADREFFSCL